MTTVYHNPRCSKSRCSLEYLQNKGVEFNVVKYLETPFDVDSLTELICFLGIKPEDLVRKNETLYKSEYKGKTISDSEWISILADNPVLIERPIVVHNNKAVIARPVERIDEIL